MTRFEDYLSTNKKTTDGLGLDIGDPATETTTFKLFRETLKPEQAPIIVSTRETSADFIWGRDNWNSDNWNATYVTSGFTVERVVCPNNTFIEYFRTNDFYDSGNSTATWDYTTDYRLEFTAGQVIQTKSIFLNNTDINNARPIITAVTSGVFSIEVSANGGTSWGVVDSGATLIFSSSGSGFDVGTFDTELFDTAVKGQDLRVRLTEITGDSVEITALKCDYNFLA